MMRNAFALRQLLGVALAVALLGGFPRALSAQPADRIRDHIYATFLLNTEKAWAVGSFGSIYHGADGGRQWQKQDSGYSDPLYGVSFVSEQEGWISGKSGLILHTTDGGNTWQRQTTGTTHHLFNLAFVDNQRGVAVGDYGIVLQTTDGGQSWTDRSLGEDVFLYGVSMHPSGKVWVAGEMGVILVSEDSGTTWTRRETGAESSLLGVGFVDENRVCAVGMDGTIVQSSDSGQTWQRYESPVQTAPYNLALNGQTGWAVGDEGVILHSTDGAPCDFKRLLQLQSVSQVFTLAITTSYDAGNVRPRFVVFYDMAGAYLLQPGIDWWFYDPFRLSIRYNFIDGKYTGIGFFKFKDSVWFELQYLLD